MKKLKLDHSHRNWLITTLLASSLFGFTLISRIAPHPANVVPVTAVTLFGGMIFPRRWAIGLPVAIMVVSDVILGLHSLVLLTWSCFALTAWAAHRWIQRPHAYPALWASIGASVFFFIVTNFGVWIEGLLYPRNLEGLIVCYHNALPFFRNSLIADLVYTQILVGAYLLVKAHVKLSPSTSFIEP